MTEGPRLPNPVLALVLKCSTPRKSLRRWQAGVIGFLLPLGLGAREPAGVCCLEPSHGDVPTLGSLIPVSVGLPPPSLPGSWGCQDGQCSSHCLGYIRTATSLTCPSYHKRSSSWKPSCLQSQCRPGGQVLRQAWCRDPRLCGEQSGPGSCCRGRSTVS